MEGIIKGIEELHHNLDIYANIASIISLIITIITLSFTTRIRKYVERSDYRRDIDAQIASLKGFCETLRQDAEVVNQSLFDDIWEQLDTIIVVYPDVLPRKLMREVKSLRDAFEKANAQEKDKFGHYAHQLSSFAKELNQLKKRM